MSFSFERSQTGFDRSMFEAAASYLKECKVPFYGSSLKELVHHFLDCDNLSVVLLIGASVPASEDAISRLESAVNRLAEGEPPQYITGIAPFFGHDFLVNQNVLIPRFDTELAVETALSFLSHGDKVADFCSGSGCIGLAIASEKPIRLTAVDISEEAGKVFSLNRDRILADIPFYAENPPRFLLCDLLSSSAVHQLDTGYDIVISNPPYISRTEMGTLTDDVLHEPRQALFGGEDGLDFYRGLTPLASHVLKDGGSLIFEIGQGQLSSVFRIMEANGFTSLRSEKDTGGIDRVVIGQKRKG